MAKSRTDSRWVRRCLLCWLGPLLFVGLAPSLLGKAQEDEFGALGLLLMPLLGLTAASLLGMACSLAGCPFHLVLLIQVPAQVLIFFYASHDASHATLPSPPLRGGQDAVVPAVQPAQKLHPPALADANFKPSGQWDQSNFLQKTKTTIPQTMSVVLPCLNEPYAAKTVMSFCNRTPSEVLEEIIVVDDASVPPMEEKLKDIPSHCNLKVLRHKESLGLMIAKQTGGDAAKGTYIGFYDCHVAPAVGWHKETIEMLSKKERRLVVPMIGDLDMDKWDEKVHGALTAKCYINFNADFWWYDDESDFIPVISGGLVATTRKWWQDSGGFDPGMRGWGGENTDQSLRAWLCGGDILRAKSSRIAHMWRVDSDPRTLSKFKLHHHTDNLARVAAIWFGEFKDKFRDGTLDPSLNVTAATRRIQDLQCKPFVHFLHRFRTLYRGGGVLPDKVFHLQLKGTDQCMTKLSKGLGLAKCTAKTTHFHLANMLPHGFPHPDDFDSPPSESGHQVVCGGHSAASCALCPQGHGQEYCHMDCRWLFGNCVPREAASHAPLEPELRFSGLRLWNSIECLDRLDASGPILYFCDITGHNLNQQYIFDRRGVLHHGSGKCVTVDSANHIVAGACEGASQWEKIEMFVPAETTRYLESVKRAGLTDDMPDG
ncbi:unnamed protein product [Effrenium voratum]|nr:unnamed protein product [Effrenium voratum]